MGDEQWCPREQRRREAHGWDDMRERLWEGRSSWLSRTHVSEPLCCRRVGAAMGLPKIQSGGRMARTAGHAVNGVEDRRRSDLRMFGA